MKNALMLLAAALLAGASLAAETTEAEARTVASNFVTKDAVGLAVLSGRTVGAVTKRGGFWLVALKPSGHLMVSVNRAAEPIPTFSERDFAEPEAGSPLEALIAAAETNALNATGARYEAQWRTLLGVKTLRLATAGATSPVSIAPLVQTAWGQGYPYDELTPVIDGGHAPVGCVATAYMQILRYWEWPERLEEDLVTEHSVDAAWGHTWRLKAGTEFGWPAMPYGDADDNPTRLKFGRAAMFAGMLAQMTYKAKASASQTSQPGRNRWFTEYVALGESNSTLAEREAAMKASLLDGCPFMVSVNTSGGGHAVVGDGWQENGSGSKYVHLNYGWQNGDSRYYGTSTPLGVYVNQKPRPMVQARPLATASALPVTVAWAFPAKGYEATLSGFDISYAEVSETVADWSDDMTNPTGTADGDKIQVEAIADCGDGNVLRIGTEAHDATYTWPTVVATAETALSYDIHSYNALGMAVEVQVRDPSVGWTTVATPTLGERSEIAWATHRVPLGAYAGKGIAVRVRAMRSGSTGYNDDTVRATGVQFDNVTLTHVRQAKAGCVGTATADAAARSAAISDSRLAAGKTYLFQVTPKFTDATQGIPGSLVSCTIAAEDSAKPTIASVSSVLAGAPKVADGMFRECYFGLNQFGVYGPAAMTTLDAYLSNLAVIGEVTVEDAAVPGTYITTHGKVPLADAVTVEKKSDGNFLVKVDMSPLTAYVRGTHMILTLVARNAQGDAEQKDVCLSFTRTGGETEIAVADLPENGGAVVTPEPEPVWCGVSFDATGGTAVEAKSVREGERVGTLAEPKRDGYTFVGWFTAATGGTRITADTVVTETVTYYAQWNKVEAEEPDPGDGDEPAVDPSDGNPNDFSDGGVNYRFCNGVTKTRGFFDVHRSGTYNTLPPISYDLIYWWVTQYASAFGRNPTDYVVPNENAMATSDKDLTIAGYTATLLNSALPTTLPTGTERAKYFPSGNVASADWQGSAADKAVQVGRHIFAALAKGPIGFKVHMSSSKFYCGVIWGCEYGSDDTGKYATKLWVTDTRIKNDGIKAFAFGNCSNEYGTMPGLKDFNGTGNHGVIEYYYPIVGPVKEKDEDKPDLPTMITVTFDAGEGTASAATREVENGTAVGELPTATLDGHALKGWFTQRAGGERIGADTVVTADVTFYAQWTAKAEEPDEPVGVAETAGDPGNDYTADYGYEMYDNYWTARKRAMRQGKQLFVLSGAAWCSNCAFVKDYLKTLGAAFADRFVVYYSDYDSTACNCFRGGLPQYGAADPRTVDAFTGTLDGGVRSWDTAWQTATSGIYAQERGGYAPGRVDLVVGKGREKAAYGTPTELVIRGLPTLGTGTVGRYELFAMYADGVEMPVDCGVAWKVVSGDGTVTDAQVDGRDVAALTVASGSVVLQAKSEFYFTGSKTITVDCAPESEIVAVEIVTDEVNLEDNATPTIEAQATLTNGRKLPVFGFGTWTAAFVRRIDRADPELEENSGKALNPTITIDNASRLNYEAGESGLLEVCDQVVNVTLTVNGKTATKAITVWGPTKVVPSKWTMLSGGRQATLGVVRLNCTELKYNYGGQIRTTTDTYFASYETVLKCGIRSQTSRLRGLTVFVDNCDADRDYKVGLRATKVNGKYKGYWPEQPEESPLAQGVTCLARGRDETPLGKGLVPQGFFRAFFPDRTDYATLADEDADGDGFRNWEEYVLGTDPTNAADAFTLMQGYQHLAAPAANSATMQYKVMYQQRAGRVYYIDAKRAWGEAWTHVATVNLAQMNADDVTKFSDLKADVADAGMFFRVRAALAEHVSTYLADAPVVAPDMLVANRGAVIDLSDGTALDLSSFDTDATDPGTVWVKVPADVAKGATLITAPKAAKASLAACRPQDRTDLAFAVVEANGRLALKVADAVPAILGGQAAVAGDRIVVTPDAGSKEITLANPGAWLVEIPATVDRIGGVADCTKIAIRSGGHDVTKAMKFTPDGDGFRIELDGNAKVRVGDEEIAVTPELSEAGDGMAPMALTADGVTLGVKTIPGLKYQVVRCATPGGTFEEVGTAKTADGARMTLEAWRTDGPSAFYAIRVGK